MLSKTEYNYVFILVLKIIWPKYSLCPAHRYVQIQCNLNFENAHKERRKGLHNTIHTCQGIKHYSTVPQCPVYPYTNRICCDKEI